MSDLSFSSSPSELRNVSNNISKYKNESLATSDNLGKQVSAIQEGWEGEASRAYAEKYTDLNNRLKNAVESIDEISRSLEAVATNMEEEEARNNSDFSDID